MIWPLNLLWFVCLLPFLFAKLKKAVKNDKIYAKSF